MNQSDINQGEWENPDNWSDGSKLFCVYFSKKDTRTWVPKRIPWLGSTINLAKAGGALWLIGILIGIPLLMVAIIIIAEAG